MQRSSPYPSPAAVHRPGARRPWIQAATPTAPWLDSGVVIAVPRLSLRAPLPGKLPSGALLWSLLAWTLWTLTLGAAPTRATEPSSAQEAVQTARTLTDQGRHQDALPLFHRVLELLDTQPPSTTQASLINETAVVHFHLGQLQEAEALYRRAILMFQTTEPRDQAGLATSLNNLAALHHRKRDFESAEPLYQQALTLRRDALGPEHPNVAFSLNELAMLYHSQRRLEEAADLYSQSLAIEEKILGTNAPELVPQLTNLAVIYRLQGLFNRAEPLFRRALEIQQQHLGERHPDVAVAINNLAVLYSVMGRFDDAEALYMKALAIQQAIFGDRHISIAMGLRNVAILYDRQGDEPKTRRTLQQIDSILQENCGAEQTAALSRDDRAVCDNALGTQRQLLDKLALDLDTPGADSNVDGAERISAAPAADRPAPPPPPAARAAQPTEPLQRPENTPTASPAAPAGVPPAGPVFRAQVRSHQGQAVAEDDLQRLRQTHGDLLEGVAGHVQEVDLGAKGVWFRVQFGDFSRFAEARRLCEALNDNGLTSCWVAKVTSP